MNRREKSGSFEDLDRRFDLGTDSPSTVKSWKQYRSDDCKSNLLRTMERIEMAANVQVSDRLKRQELKYSGRCQSVPPESDHGEKRFFNRKQNINKRAYEDERETCSEGDYSHGKKMQYQTATNS